MSRIREEYVATGKVRFVYKHFAILGPESNRSAEASECAAEQEKFWEYHDRLFQNAGAAFSPEKLTEIAAQVGLDSAAFAACLGSSRYAAQISQESLSVQSLGVRGTPAFLLNGIFISGAQPFEAFQQIIDEQLAVVENQPPTSPADSQESVEE